VSQAGVVTHQSLTASQQERQIFEFKPSGQINDLLSQTALDGLGDRTLAADPIRMTW